MTLSVRPPVRREVGSGGGHPIRRPATGSPHSTAGPPESPGFIYKLAINIWPSFILIHSFLAQMEWILNLVGQGHPHAACLAVAVKLFFILRGGI